MSVALSSDGDGTLNRRTSRDVRAGSSPMSVWYVRPHDGPPMTTADDDLLRAFESTDLPSADFTHAAHVHVAWCYLQRDRFAVALDRFSQALRAFAVAKGVPGLYHETLTVAWMALIHERLDAPETREQPWDAFAAAHPELFEKPPLVSRYYDRATLKTPRARRVFVLPAVPVAHE